jgi:dihydrolipoamide dehydrogenase
MIFSGYKMSQAVFDLVVIGSGPGGEVGAIRAAQLGLKVAIVEKNPFFGGTCLNWGCIPTKALLESARTFDKLKIAGELGFSIGEIAYDWQKIQARKDKIVDQQRKGLEFLIKKNKIEVFRGWGKLLDRGRVSVTAEGGETKTIQTKNVLLATGSKVRNLPFAMPNGKNILSSDEVLFIDQVPESLCIVGGGVVGMEFASLFGRFGSSVTVIEAAPQILPSEDGEVVKEMSRLIKKQNVTVETNAKLTKVEDKGKYVEVHVEGKEVRKFAKILMSVGREPVTKDIGLEALGIKTDRGFVTVNERYQSNVNNIYAIGDIIPTPALAHTASAEAIHAVEVIAGHKPPLINYDANPNAIYTYPEVASIGKTEEILKAKGVSYKVAKFPFAPMAKAKIEMATDGFVKILYEPKHKEILGVHILGSKATEMIAEFVLGKILETTVDEIGLAIHPHPTISETIMEAAHVASGGAIHL